MNMKEMKTERIKEGGKEVGKHEVKTKVQRN